jgi:hypothetical protein
MTACRLDTNRSGSGNTQSLSAERPILPPSGPNTLIDAGPSICACGPTTRNVIDIDLSFLNDFWTAAPLSP